MPSTKDRDSRRGAPPAADTLEDVRRLAILGISGLIDSPTDESFDNLTRLTARALGAPIVMVSLVDADTQYVKSSTSERGDFIVGERIGLHASICQHVVREGQPLIAEDTRDHPLLSTNPYVIADKVGAYAGYPIIAGGAVLGSFCALSPTPRKWSATDRETLRQGAAVISEQIERRLRVIAQTNRISGELAHLTALLDATNDALIGATLTGEIVSWNAGATTLFGFSADEAIGRNSSFLVPLGHRDETDDILARVARGERIAHREMRCRHRNGSLVDVSVSVTPVLDPAGEVVGATSIARNITERKQAERALRTQKAFLRAVIDANPHPIFVKDRAGRFTLVNRAAADLYGITPEEMVGRTDAELSTNPDEVAGMVAADRQVIDSGEPLMIPEETLTNPHTLAPRYLTTTKVRFLPPDGGEAQLLGIAHDITERRELELQLRQTQKLEALGQLAGAIAHDFNNVLTVIIGNADTLLMDMPAGNPWRTDVADIRDAAGRAAGLTRQLLSFSRKRPISAQPMNLNDSVRQMEPMLARVIGARLKLIVDLDPDLPPVVADATQIEQILVNLSVNARDAMPSGGTLTIRTRSVETEVSHGDAPAGTYAAIEVEDTGVGISPEIRAQVFEPFFTTKPAGKGTGLGLSTVNGIATQAGGFCTVASEVGRGTTLTVHLPIDPAPSQSD